MRSVFGQVLARLLLSMCPIFLAPSFAQGQLAAPVPADEKSVQAPVVYMAQGEYPEKVIRNLAYAQGYQLAPGGTDRARRATVSGRLSGSSLSDLITQLGRNHGFDHFVHGATIYLFDPSDWRTETIYLGFKADESFRDNLSQYGLMIPRFKLLNRPEQESIVVTAPRQYIALLERILKSERETPQQDILVFRLRYASADDRVMTLRDRQVVTPGVATLLRGILTGQSVTGQTITPQSGVGQSASAQSISAPAAFSGFSAGALLPLPLGGLPPLPGALGSNDGQGGNVFGSGTPGADTAFANGSNNGPGSGQINGANNGPGSSAAAQAAANAGQRLPVTVQADVRTNSVIIRDRPQREPVYRKLIDMLDLPLDMVEIEAVLIDIDQRKLEELGVQWSFQNRTLGMDFPSQGGLNQFNVNGSTAVVNDRGKFVARLQALMADNNARVLARPTILTLDNLSGVIDLTQTFFTRVQGERVANVVPVVAGSLLRVSPRIVRDASGSRSNEIQLQVDIEDGSLKDRQGLDLPTVQKNAISTQASIFGEQSILIGGYTREAEEQTEFKVPILGDLPLIGPLMRSRNTNVQKMTRLFLITPRILSTGAASMPVTSQVEDRLQREHRRDLNALVPRSTRGLSTELSLPRPVKDTP